MKNRFLFTTLATIRQCDVYYMTHIMNDIQFFFLFFYVSKQKNSVCQNIIDCQCTKLICDYLHVPLFALYFAIQAKLRALSKQVAQISIPQLSLIYLRHTPSTQCTTWEASGILKYAYVAMYVLFNTSIFIQSHPYGSGLNR